MAELLPRGFVSVFRTGRGRLPVAVLGGFYPRRSQEQFRLNARTEQNVLYFAIRTRSRCAFIAWLSMGGQAQKRSTTAPTGLRNMAVAALLPIG